MERNQHYQIDLETRSRIVSMKNFSTSTYPQIAEACNCSVSLCRFFLFTFVQNINRCWFRNKYETIFAFRFPL